MLLLINVNRMVPPIAPVALDYIAGAVRRSCHEVSVLDLCFAPDPSAALVESLARQQPELIGISFRNLDDCFWPGTAWFLPALVDTIRTVRNHSRAPIVLGGIGFSVCADRILSFAGADFGVRGDGEHSVNELLTELRGDRRFDRVDGLLWRDGGYIRANRPAWPAHLTVPSDRGAVDNARYFRTGGQVGVETKRGCNRACVYCAERLAKGPSLRLRDPREVADEVESLLAQGIDVLHLCDSEFNIPLDHAEAVCNELISRSMGDRVRWYTYMAAVPLNAALVRAMRRAGCVGINFTSDSASPQMLMSYGQIHRPEDLARAVCLCRSEGIAVMLDLLFGGPGETRKTAAETIDFVRSVNPDCAGAALGIRVYANTPIETILAKQGSLDGNPGIRRHYDGPVDLLKPTFYVSPALGDHPAVEIRELIAGDSRFFEPADDLLLKPPTGAEAGNPSPLEAPKAHTAELGDSPPLERRADPYADYNYNDNRTLMKAIENGARGAYWDILRRLRS